MNPLNLFRRATTWAVLAALVIVGVLLITSTEARSPARRNLILGGGPFKPESIPTLVVRLDFDDVSTLFQDTSSTISVTSSGQSIALIRNKGTLGGAFSQSTAGERPTYNGSLIGASFDGGDRLVSTLAASNFNFLHNGSRWVVLLDFVSPSGAGAGYMLDTHNGSSGNFGFHIESSNTAIATWITNGGSTVLNFPGDTIAASTRYIVAERFEDNISGSDFVRWVNGVQGAVADRSAAPSVSNATNTLYVGARQAQAPFSAARFAVSGFGTFLPVIPMTSFRRLRRRLQGNESPRRLVVAELRRCRTIRQSSKKIQ